jgi:hypothetical protein
MEVATMRASTAKALYELSIDAFLEGVADEPTKPETLGLSEQEAERVRAKLYSERLRTRRERAA